MAASLIPRRGYFLSNDENVLGDFVYECGPFILFFIFLGGVIDWKLYLSFHTVDLQIVFLRRLVF